MSLFIVQLFNDSNDISQKFPFAIKILAFITNHNKLVHHFMISIFFPIFKCLLKVIKSFYMFKSQNKQKKNPERKSSQNNRKSENIFYDL